MDNDLDKITRSLAKRAGIDKKREKALQKEMEKEAKRQAPLAPIEEQYKQQYGDSMPPEKSIYTVVAILKLEYQEEQRPDEKKLAEDVARTLIKWVEQKSIISIDPKEPVPELVSLDVDVQ